jgi:hypothetical protein
LQSASEGHFDDGNASVEAPRRVDWVAERAGDGGGAVGAAEGVEDALAPVGDRDLDAVVPELPTGVTDGGSDLGSGGRSTELVDCGHDAHGPNLVGGQCGFAG